MRLNERFVSRQEIQYVLHHGKRNRKEDAFDEKHQSWKYAIEGMTLDRDKKLRLIVALKDDVATLISVFQI